VTYTDFPTPRAMSEEDDKPVEVEVRNWDGTFVYRGRSKRSIIASVVMCYCKRTVSIKNYKKNRKKGLSVNNRPYG
jgi:hypothetical protein